MPIDDLKCEATHGPRYPDQWGAKRSVVMVSSGEARLQALFDQGMMARTSCRPGRSYPARRV